jgi:hypothetical protein
MLTGAAIAIKPLMQLIAAFSVLTDFVPRDTFALPEAMLSQLPIMVAVGFLLVIGFVTFQVSED